MKSLYSCIIPLIFLCLFAANGESQTNNTEKDKIYGVKNSSSISVHIKGGGIRYPGTYCIESGSTLHDLVANNKACWMRSSDGTFQISRIVNGKKVTIPTDYTQWSIKLLDGDDIFAPGMHDIH